MSTFFNFFTVCFCSVVTVYDINIPDSQGDVNIFLIFLNGFCNIYVTGKGLFVLEGARDENAGFRRFSPVLRVIRQKNRVLQRGMRRNLKVAVTVVMGTRPVTATFMLRRGDTQPEGRGYGERWQTQPEGRGYGGCGDATCNRNIYVALWGRDL
jgi:hypothetical protein